MLTGDSPDADRTVYLWPENAHAWGLWLRCQTQWRRAGMDGTPTGLDYAGVSALVDLHTPRRRRRETFALLQAMELAALDEWRKQRK